MQGAARIGLIVIGFCVGWPMPESNAADIEDYKQAIAKDDPAELVALLRADGRQTPRDAEGNTVLHLACSPLAWRNRAGAVAAVLAAGADPNAANDRGFTPLHFAATTDCTDCVKALIAAGANVGTRRIGGKTPLHFSSATALPLLLAAGADLKVRDDDGRTVLHTSSLTDARLRVLGVNVTDRFGFTPLHYAALQGTDERIDWLLASGADPALQSTAAFTNRHLIDVAAFDADLLEFPAGQRPFDLARFRHEQTRWSSGRYRSTFERLDKVTPRRSFFSR
ncbi:ankyrin repeat protein [Panacagrimonas perspica]|uniref:Ankyrin repeat protein n=2 Tax=Panacagrimonas perspica TaxID=381431 RepID=A0A4R7P3Y7_9GAMM|nr:ankyrin repeat protein [Panacagrimonas perspica]